jgi:peptidoglycan/LPS O-acetylase OafA/YrhL
LTVVVLAILSAGWFLSLPYHFLVTGQSTVALIALASNVYFWRTTDYFAPLAEENPMLHTWSLSVEEQFYLIVPFLLLSIFWLRREKFVPTLLVAGTVISFICSVIYLRYDPTGAFYLLPSRAWELGIGSILAVLPASRNKPLRSMIGYLGVALILYTFFFYDSGDSFPGIRAVPPVLGAAFIIFAGINTPESTFTPLISRVIGSKPLVFVGLSSYSFYLWHWPFFAYHRYLYSHPPTASTAILYIILSFLISVGSLYFVERPFRGSKSKMKRPQVFLYGGLTILVLLACSVTIHIRGGVPSRVPAKVVELDSLHGENKYMEIERFIQISDKVELKVIGNIDLNPTLLVWGDSHARASLPGIDSALKELGRSGVVAERGGTAPAVNWATDEVPAVQLDYSQTVFDYAKAAKSNGLSHVLLIFYWSAYVQEQETPDGFRRPPSGFAEALSETILELQRAGLKVGLFMETPIFPVHIARAVALNEWRGTPAPKLSYAENRAYRSVYDSVIETIRSNAPDLEIYDPQLLFKGEDDEFEFLDSDEKLLFRDHSHLTQHGSMRLEPQVLEFLKENKSHP